MKIKLQDAVNMAQTLTPWMENSSLNIMSKYRLAKICKRLSEEVDFYRGNLNLMVQAYAVPGQDLNDEQIAIQPDKIDEFNQKLKELYEIPVELDDELKIEIADLEPLNPTVKDLMTLEAIIK